MLKLLIVDDEEIIRNGLMKLFDWDSLGFEIVGAAEDGNQALDMVKERKPDIILTDIRMPFKDGLELIGEVKSVSEDIYSILLTGYDEFQFAKKAVELGAYSYILKPVEPEALLSTLKKIGSEIAKKRKEKERINELVLEVEENRQLKKEYLVLKVVNGAYESETDDKEVEKLGLDKQVYSVAIIEEESESDSHLNDLIQQSLASMDSSGRIGWVKYRKKTVLAWAWGENECQVGKTISDFAALLKKEQQGIRLSGLTIGLGMAHRGIPGISCSFNEAVEALNYKFIAGNNTILDAKVTSRENSQNHVFTNNMAEIISEGIRTGNRKTIAGCLDEIFENAISMGAHAKAFIQISVTNVYIQALKTVSENGGNIGEIFDDPVGKFDEIISSKTLSKCLDLLSSALAEISEYVFLKKNRKYSSIVGKAEKYIKDNYCDAAFSLSKAANYVGMSSCYFSTIWKQEKGVSFIDFLMKLRLQKSKELLSDPRYMAYEVCEMVGYENYPHFSAFFKKNTGMSPVEYKKSVYGKADPTEE